MELLRCAICRPLLSVSLVIIMTSPVAAAPAHRAKPRHDVVRPHVETTVPPGWYKFPGYPPIPPEQNRNLDPSNYGGG